MPIRKESASCGVSTIRLPHSNNISTIIHYKKVHCQQKVHYFSVIRLFGLQSVCLAFCNVADAPFQIQVDGISGIYEIREMSERNTLWQRAANSYPKVVYPITAFVVEST